jgi:hypothetical protein
MVDSKKPEPAIELDETGRVNWAKLPRAKRDAMLTDYSQALKGCHKQGTFSAFGMFYTLRTLDPADETWTLQFIQGEDYYALGKSRRPPTVAAAIVAMGRDEKSMKPVEELFQIPPDLPEVSKHLITRSEFFERDWRRTEVLRYLMEPENHETVIAYLYNCYLGLERERNEALGALDPLSKKIPTGASSDTSLPEPAGSSPTPASAS